MKTDAIDKAIEGYLKIDEKITADEYWNFSDWEKQLYMAYWTKKKYDGYQLESMPVSHPNSRWKLDDDEFCYIDFLYRILPDISVLDIFLKSSVKKDDNNNEIIYYNQRFLLELYEFINDQMNVKTKGE